jgi:hypothetical protein
MLQSGNLTGNTMSQYSVQKPNKEQQFFADPALDRIMGSLMSLAVEVYVLRSRVSALEVQAIKGGLTDSETLSEGIGDDETKELKADARQFAEALLKPLLGLQDALGLPED